MSKRLLPQEKISLIKRFEAGEKLSSLCREAEISRTIFYKWLRAYASSENKESALKTKNPSGKNHWRKLPLQVETKIIKTALAKPEFSPEDLSQVLRVSPSKIWQTLKNRGLNNQQSREQYFRKYRVSLVNPIRSEDKLAMVRRFEAGEKVANICRDLGISRPAFYKWLNRYQQAKPELKRDVLEVSRPAGEKHWRFVPEARNLILEIISQKPELSVHKISQELTARTGRQILGSYGVFTTLKKLGLNTYEQRLAYSKAQNQVIQPVIKPVTTWDGKLRAVWETFVPQRAPAPPPALILPVSEAAQPPSGSSFRSRYSYLIRPFLTSFFSTTFVCLIFLGWLSMLSGQPLGAKIGLTFASISLATGMFFFLYSMKSYLTMALVLSFSSQGVEVEVKSEENRGAEERSASKGWLEKIFGLNGKTNGSSSSQAGGLQADLSHVNLERYPFISIQLPMYNEKKVANRLISACTSMDYPNFEVLVCDDSNDETVEIVNSWASHPRVKVLHRPDRSGFKGGALSYALKAMDPRTEFVVIFDADFVPYPDTLMQFMKYFKSTGGWNEEKNYECQGITTMPYKTLEEVEVSSQMQEVLAKQESQLRGNNDIAVVAGYQWHVLNKSENWITRGVRTEYAGSYVIERPGQEILNAMKIIHGSVYCMRADVLKHFGWGTSITEDYELTLRIYEKGFKVIFTPYIQAPSECVSTLKRLVRQRMRWAEGHSFNTKKMFWKLLFTPHMTKMEKLEFLYLTPYYLQAFFFIIGTFSWLLSEMVFGVRLPFWTSVWGWSLVLTNLFALPLVNAIGLFLEESEEKDYLGILSFVALCYLVVPFQAYAAVKGFIEPKEGGWFRTPKTGIITDALTRGRFYRWLTDLFRLRPSTGSIAHAKLVEAPAFNPYFALSTAHNTFNNFHIRPSKRLRMMSNFIIVGLVLTSVVLQFLALPLSTTLAYDGTFYFRNAQAGSFESTTVNPAKQMSTGALGSNTEYVNLDPGQAESIANAIYLHDANGTPIRTQEQVATASAAANGTSFATQKKLFRDLNGNLIMIYINSNADIKAMYKNYDSNNWDIYSGDLYAGTVTNLAGALDGGNLHMAFEESYSVKYKRVVISRTNGRINSSGWTLSESVVTLAGGTSSDWQKRPTIVMDRNSNPAVAWGRHMTATKDSGPRFTFCCTNGSGCSTNTDLWEAAGLDNCSATPTAGIGTNAVGTGPIHDPNAYSDYHVSLAKMPSTDALYMVFMQGSAQDLFWSKATATGGYDYNAWSAASSLSSRVSTYTSAAPYSLALEPDHLNNRLVFAWSDSTSNYTTVKYLASDNDTPVDISPSNQNWGVGYSLYITGDTAANQTYYLLHQSSTTGGTIDYHTYTGGSWSGSSYSFAANGTNSYPLTRGEDAGVGGDLGGRLDVLWSRTTGQIIYRNIPFEKNMDATQGTTPQAQLIGDDGWDRAVFRTATVSASTPVNTNDWKAKVCVGTGYTTQHVKIKWQLLNADNLTVACESTEKTWSKATTGAGCEDGTTNLTFSSPANSSTGTTCTGSPITDLQNYRISLVLSYDNDGADSVPLVFDGNTTTTDAKLTYYHSGSIVGNVDSFYVLTDNFNRRWSASGDIELTDDATNAEQRNVDLATHTDGTSYAVWEDERNSEGGNTFAYTKNSMSQPRYVPHATLLNNGKVLVTGGQTGASSWASSAELYDPVTNTFSTVGNMSVARANHSSTLLSNGKVLVSGGCYNSTSCNIGLSTSEIFDPATNTFTATANNLSNTRQDHSAALLNNGKVLLAGGIKGGLYTSSAEIFDPATNTFSTTSNMQGNHRWGATTLLPNGKVLIVAGTTATGASGYSSTAELYDPVTNTFSRTANNIRTALYITGAIPLQNGKVLLAGGWNASGQSTTAEIYDPSTNMFSWLPNAMSNGPRSNYAYATLNNGKVLLATGSPDGGESGLNSAEIFDPLSNTFSLLPNIVKEARTDPNSILLNDGRVLILGGCNGSECGTQLSTAELFTPKTSDVYMQKFDSSGQKVWGSDLRVNSDDGNRTQSSSYTYPGTWSTTGNSRYQYYNHASAVLPDGRILVAGTESSSGSVAELYDPASGTFSTVGNMQYKRSYNTATTLNTGKVLVVGTTVFGSLGNSIPELYDPATRTFSTTSIIYGRDRHTATLLPSGKVLVSGTYATSVGQSVAELYDPNNNTWSTTSPANFARYSSSATLLSNGKVLISGSDLANGGNSIAEIYDPVTNTWSTISSLNVARQRNQSILLNNGKVLILGSFSGVGQSIPELYDPQNNNFSILPATNFNYTNRFSLTILNNGKVLMTGSSSQSIAEIFDPVTNTFSTSAASVHGHVSSTTNLLSNGKVVIIGGGGGSSGSTVAELFDATLVQNYSSNYDHLNPKVKLDSAGNPIVTWQEARNSVYGDDIYAQKFDSSGNKQWPSATTNTWSTTSPATYARTYHTTTLLTNGKVLAVGTQNNGGQTIAELYDPQTNTWSTTAPARYDRDNHTATILTNGKVLAVGTQNGDGQSIAELYDPSTNTWATTAPATYDRGFHTTALLTSGKVLVSGTGFLNGGRSIAELYDPSTGTWVTTAPATYGRYLHTITLLTNGKVLAVGTNIANGGQTIAELYDPSTGTWVTTAPATYGRYDHTTTLLTNGKVLAVGTNYDNGGRSIAELYDPSTGTWVTTAPATYGRYDHTTTLLTNGKVLVAGTSAGNGGRSIAELYDPSTGTWVTTAPATYGRYDHTTTLLTNGKVLAVGTGSVGYSGMSIAELYTPSMDIQVSNDGSPTNGLGLPNPEYPGMKGILGEQRNPTLTVDSDNNAIIAWEDNRLSALQNWSLAGNGTNWNNAAHGVCNGGGGTQNSCGAKASILGNPVRIMGQKIQGTNGAKVWGSAGQNLNNPQDLGLSATGDMSQNPAIVADGTNVVLTWQSNGKNSSGNESRDYDIYTQKFDTNGQSKWGGTWSSISAMPYARNGHTATLLDNGKVLFAGGGSLSQAELYDPVTNIFSAVGNMSNRRSSHTATLLNNGKVLVAGGSSSILLSQAELYDPATNTFSTVGNMSNARYSHSATLLADGKVLIAGGMYFSGSNFFLSQAELFDPATNTFSTVGNLPSRLVYHTATLLNNGKVLLTGGYNGNLYTSQAELFDPVTNTFSTISNMTNNRGKHNATLLENGKVFVSGGFNGNTLSQAELYDPLTNTFSTIGSMANRRYDHTATLLTNGKVLMSGGVNYTSGYFYLSQAEVYDPKTNIFSDTGNMLDSRSLHTATLLPNGKVLVAGGSASSSLSQAELYSLDQMVNSGADLADQTNPQVVKDGDGNLVYAWQGRRGSGPGGGGFNSDSERGSGSYKVYGMKTSNPTSGNLTSQWPNGTTGTWSTAGAMTYSKNYASATLLNSGKLLITGSGGSTIPELYDPLGNTWSLASPMTYQRSIHAATLLNSGKLIVTGSYWDNGGRSIAEIYDPGANTWTALRTSTYTRDRHTGTLLNNGKILVVGTEFTNGGQTIAEVYDPATDTWSTTQPLRYYRYSHTATLLPSGKVLVMGSGGGTGGGTGEIYDPAANTWSTTGAASGTRGVHTATLLNNGKVLFVGSGYTDLGQTVAEIYDPAANTWSTTGATTYIRSRHTATLLPSGKVLVAGAAGDNGGRTIPEVYDPLTGTWTTTGASLFARDAHTTTLLANGKLLMAGTAIASDGGSIPELYTPSGEMMLSHDGAIAGNQTNVKLAADGVNTIAVWEDDRTATASASYDLRRFTDKNIYMQKFDTTGAPQWPAATSNTNYSSPYAVMDVRVDSSGGLGTHYSGKPAIGGLYSLTTGEKPINIAWSDNRDRAIDPMNIYAQSYDTNEYNISKITNWGLHWHYNVNTTGTVAVKVAIAEWNGQVVEKGQGNIQNWAMSSTGAGDTTMTWTSGGANPPPSDNVGNVTMRRAMIVFTRVSGDTDIYFDNNASGYDSKLSTGAVVPERSYALFVIVPFLPPMVNWYLKKRRRKEEREGMIK